MKKIVLETCEVCSSTEDVEGGVCAECFAALPCDQWVSLDRFKELIETS